MKPRKTYDDTSDSQGAPSSGNYLPCRVCHGSTPKATLSQYGVMCHFCFANYCAAGGRGTTPAVMTRQQKTELLQRLRETVFVQKNHRGWAEAIRDREARGEKLTRAQRDMLEAVRPSP